MRFTTAPTATAPICRSSMKGKLIVNAFNVVRVGIDEDAFRSAVSTIIDDIQRSAAKEPLSLVEIAESINVSLGTISNAKNRNASLSAEFLARLGQVYGAAYLNPYFAL